MNYTEMPYTYASLHRPLLEGPFNLLKLHAKGEVRFEESPSRQFGLIVSETPLEFGQLGHQYPQVAGPPLRNARLIQPGYVYSGQCGDAENTIRVLALAHLEGWRVPQALSPSAEFEDFRAARTQDALEWLNLYRVAEGQTLFWHQGDLICADQETRQEYYA